MTNHEKDWVLRLAGLARRDHYTCEDAWWSCPKSPDGCLDDNAGDGCNCGADRLNADIDEILKVLDLETKK